MLHHADLCGDIIRRITDDVTDGRSLIEITAALVGGLGFVVATGAQGDGQTADDLCDFISNRIMLSATEYADDAAELRRIAAEG